MPVLLIATGGTIASRPLPDGGVATALTGADLVERAGLDADGVRVVDAVRGPSWSLAPAAMAEIARVVVDSAASGQHDGVVVTHGTDTIEETLFLTWLLGGAAASRTSPIVFTGAMRHDAHPDTDGPANLRDAVALAGGGGPVAGPVLRMAGRTHHARWTTKTDTTSVTSFTGAPDAPHDPPPHGSDVAVHVAQVQSHVGVDGGAVDWHVERGARGIVVEGTGAGNVHVDLVDGIERAIGAGVPVVVTSRCWTGPVSATYGTRGGGHMLAALGAIGGGDLPTHKARLALSVAIGLDPSVDGVRSWFTELLG